MGVQIQQLRVKRRHALLKFALLLLKEIWKLMGRDTCPKYDVRVQMMQAIYLMEKFMRRGMEEKRMKCPQPYLPRKRAHF